jgi:hypothetical protein
MWQDYLLAVNPDRGFQNAAGDLLRRHRVRGAGVGLGHEDQGWPLLARTPFLRSIAGTIPINQSWGDTHAVGGVPVLRRFETAVTSCADAKGFDMRMLFGTPCAAHSSTGIAVT